MELMIGLAAVLLIVMLIFFILMRQIGQLHQEMSRRLDTNVQTVADHLGIITGQISNTTNVVSKVEGRLGAMQETSRQIFDLAKDISSLHNILQSPKMRGGFGEFLLEDLLSQCLPKGSFHLQYSFGVGTVVDAALFAGSRILCVDSKFPLENFRKMHASENDQQKKAFRKAFIYDVKKHVNDIASRYIQPDENTFDFAFMFIPAEHVYYEIITRDEGGLYQHCLDCKVIPVSPNTFYAYLQIILLGLRGLQISEEAKKILGHLQQIEIDVERFSAEFAKAGAHIRDAQNCILRADERLTRLKQRLNTIQSPDASADELERI